MKRKYEKNIRIINDLMGYCYYLGARDMRVDLQLPTGRSVVRVEASIPLLQPEVVRNLENVLNIPRQREIEQNYWNVSGEEEIDNELTLAAVMIDSAKVTYRNDVLTIEAHRLDD